MRVLDRTEVERLLDVDELLGRLGRAFVELSAGRASVPPRVAAFAPAGLLGAMPGYVDGVLAAKLVALFPDHKPSHQAPKSMGHAVEDAAAAALVLERAGS